MITYPTGSYVYAYLRKKDNSPYYIGKGIHDRAWQRSSHTLKIPDNAERIIIIEENLTDLGALAIERRMIRWYGRKDTGTGILRNLTDGGDGTRGRVVSEKTKLLLSKAQTGKIKLNCRKPKSLETKANMKKAWELRDRTVKESTRRLLSIAGTGRIGPNLGKKMSEQTKAKLRGPEPKFVCEYCLKEIGGKGNYVRWHGENCAKYHYDKKT